MIQVTIFAGHDGKLRLDRGLYLTLFGGCDLTRPTLARHVLGKREMERQGRPHRYRPFFLTIFAGVDIKSPTLAEEFLDLRESLNNGLLSMQEWERSLADQSRSDGGIGSLTLFGGFDECVLPSEKQEIDALAVHRHLGNISETAGQILQFGIGQRDGERCATVRRAVLAET